MSEGTELPLAAERLIGRVLAGVYRLDEIIATGATSVVYRGTHIRLDQSIAVKVLAGSVVTNAALMGRFQAEAKVQAKLNHPHIVTVHDFISEGDMHAIAMECVEGVGLDHVMYELAGPMELQRIKHLIRPVLEAIDYAHSCGIVHRDLKPSNILLTHVGGREFPKVMDFGIAKVLAGEVSVTAPGAMLGTLLFMSPEQCKALKTVDKRADIYSLGVTLYQMATGMVPFYSESAFDIMLAHVQSPPVPPGELVESVSPDLEAVILKAIAKDPEDRFDSANQMADALDRATGTHRAVGTLMKRGRQDNAGGEISAPPDGDSSVDTEVVMPDELQPGKIGAVGSRGRDGPPAASSAASHTSLTRSVLEGSGISSPSSRGPRPTGRHGAGPAQSTRLEPGSYLLKRTRPSQAVAAVAEEEVSPSTAAEAPVSPPDESATAVRLRLRVPSPSDWKRYFGANIAGGGVFVPVADPPEVGTPTRLEVLFVGGPRFLMSGMVTWRRPPLNDPRARAGVGVQLHPSERSKLTYLTAWVEGDEAERRQLRRLPIKLRVAYSGRTGRRVNFTRDLNEEGIFVRSRELLTMGTPIELVLVPPSGTKPYRLHGKVSRLVEAPEERGMGISLIFAQPLDKERFRDFIEDLEHKFLSGKLPEDLLY